MFGAAKGGINYMDLTSGLIRTIPIHLEFTPLLHKETTLAAIMQNSKVCHNEIFRIGITPTIGLLDMETVSLFIYAVKSLHS